MNSHEVCQKLSLSLSAQVLVSALETFILHFQDPKQRPLNVSRGPMSNPLYHAFIEAGTQAGYQKSADLNGETFEVVSYKFF